MILTIDIGNSNICFGVYEGQKRPLYRPRQDGSPAYRNGIRRPFSRRSSACISPIRPSLPARPSPRSYRRSPPYSTMPSASSAMAISPPLWLAPGSKPASISALMNPLPWVRTWPVPLWARRKKYPLPAIIIDLGTATKITVVTEDRSFIGGAILPGVKIRWRRFQGRPRCCPPSVSVPVRSRPSVAIRWIVCSPVWCWAPPVWWMALLSATERNWAKFPLWWPAAAFPRLSCRIAAPTSSSIGMRCWMAFWPSTAATPRPNSSEACILPPPALGGGFASWYGLCRAGDRGAARHASRRRSGLRPLARLRQAGCAPPLSLLSHHPFGQSPPLPCGSQCHYVILR